MAERLDIVSTRRKTRVARGSAFAHGEVATLPCARCKRAEVPWELRSFGGKAICRSCFDATLELARGAMAAMPADPARKCSSCRATRDPSLGSAWCPLTELGDSRAVICANFVSIAADAARLRLSANRVSVIDVWRAASEELRATLGERSYEHWFGEIEAVELHEREIVLAAPDDYTRDWLEQRLQPVVRNALAVAGYPNLVPTYRVEPGGRQRNDAGRDERSIAKAPFNPHYTFAEFIVGAGNRLAHASALACVDKPGRVYNPLVLYGGVGVGKTHLLQAIGQEAIDQGRGHALYVTSETFTNELILAIRDGATGAFREKYRSVDFLLLDDIQFIAGKEATQEEFFHTFNALHQANKQIVISSDRPPEELRVLEDRLRSRFAWGLTADMQPPDLETRMAIVRSKAAMRGRRLPETVLDAIASRAGRNVRELEGTLNRILALADMMEREPDMELARTVLGDPDEMSTSCRPADVLQAVSAYFRVKASDLAGQQRERRIAYARQMAMYLLREEAKLSLVEVGHQLGGRNHSTVIYGCDKIAESRARGRVKQDLVAIKQLIYGVR
ncbi:MAG TPA: chromosomal replication initiator protein DnaA [Chloroflexota bacterium]|nr:chromosomal replication initiator protein DnaA [Chloroflexota bacterium]